MKYAHPRMKDHQKLLRNLMIIELIVRILEGYDPKASDARYVCVSAFKFLSVKIFLHLVTISQSVRHATK